MTFDPWNPGNYLPGQGPWNPALQAWPGGPPPEVVIAHHRANPVPVLTASEMQAARDRRRNRLHLLLLHR